MTTTTIPEPVIEPERELPAGEHERVLDPEPPIAARRVSWLWRGRPEDPRWVRPALLTLLAGTALLYLWDLGASGWSNAFYSAAVQAGTKSWKAFFFGSSDASNFITVDKPPASLWVMEISRASSVSTRGASSCPRRSKASRRSACSTRRCGAGSRPAPGSSPAR